MDNDIRVISALTERFFCVFDNRQGRRPRAADFEDLFIVGAMIATHGGTEPTFSSPSVFVTPRVALLTSGDLVEFHEWETDAHTEVIGPFAARRSRYAKSGLLRGRATSGTGTKFFHFAKVHGDWRIALVSWIDDPAP